MKGFAGRLLLKQRYKVTRKWPISATYFYFYFYFYRNSR